MGNIVRESNPFRLVVSMAAVVIILGGLRASAGIISPVLLAIFFAILITPIYHWFLRRGLPAWLSMLLVLAGIVAVGLALGLFFSSAVNQLLAVLTTYQSETTENLEELQSNYPGLLEVDVVALSAQVTQWIRVMLGAILSLVSSAVVIVVVILFTVLDAGPLYKRLQESLGEDSSLLQQATGFARSMVRYFAIRTRINLFTGLLVTLMLLLFRIDFAVLWGILTFFLSYVPYVGIVLATAPSVAIAFAQGGAVKALLVILGVTAINLSAENVIAPTMLGRGLSISPVVVFVSFIFWAWVLGAPGTLLAMPLTVAIMLLLAAFDSTRWVAVLMGMPAKGFDMREAAADGETASATNTGSSA